MTEIASYIQGLDLPFAPTRGAGEEEPPPPIFKSVDQALTVGSQMAEFSDKVPQSIRAAISNGLLLGQLAADKATAGNADPVAWFDAFNGVMKKIGWQVTAHELNEETLSDKNASLHEAIIPIIEATFGGAAAAGSIILTVLKGLESKDQNAPWITVFQQKSNKVKAATFGMSYVDGGDSGGATLKSAYFTLQGSQKLMQILLFKFKSSDATMKSGRCDMALSAETLTTSQDVLRQKVAPFIVDNIKNIDI